MQKLTNVDELTEVDVLDEPILSNASKSDNVNTSKAMLWHTRMGLASVSYLRKLKDSWKGNKDLQSVVFDDSILDYEVYALSKITKLPFKNERTRAT